MEGNLPHRTLGRWSCGSTDPVQHSGGLVLRERGPGSIYLMQATPLAARSVPAERKETCSARGHTGKVTDTELRSQHARTQALSSFLCPEPRNYNKQMERP